jgi:hypothetical protein
MNSFDHGIRDKTGQSLTGRKRWRLLIGAEEWHELIRQTPRKVAVVDRLYRALEDVRRANGGAGLILDEKGDRPQVGTSAGCSRAGGAKATARSANEADARISLGRITDLIAAALQTLTRLRDDLIGAVADVRAKPQPRGSPPGQRQGAGNVRSGSSAVWVQFGCLSAVCAASHFL